MRRHCPRRPRTRCRRRPSHRCGWPSASMAPSPKSKMYVTTVPSGSLDGDASSVMAAGATPATAGTLRTAFGALFAPTFTVACAGPDEVLLLSTATRVTENVPAVVYVWVTTGLDVVTAGDPSPKSNRYDTTVPSGSVEADPSSVTVSGPTPLPGVAASAAFGGFVPLA